jgi:cytochrome c peroxidase
VTLSATLLLLSACGGGTSDSGVGAPLSAQAALGEQIFNDASLSTSGQMSCAGCHVSAYGHAQSNNLAAQFGGPNLDLQGARVSPGIRYLSFSTAFFFDKDGTPTGGFFWDGRASSLADQAGGPFLNPVEMALPDEAAVIARIAQGGYAQQFQQTFGADIFSRPGDAYEAVKLALQHYQQEDRQFQPFSSKYDAFLRGNTLLSEQEMRGLALFNNPAKGNCQGCHPSASSPGGALPLFTDFTYDHLGVPRNWELQANADPAYYDLGLCARPSGDLVERTDLCGAFKVPTLRNVALRQALFHNGRFKNLKDALTFYVQRDITPEKFYLKADGVTPDDKFNDLPAEYRRNVNTEEAPYNRQPGDAPALSDAEIDDLIAFLNTLTDGWTPAP